MIFDGFGFLHFQIEKIQFSHLEFHILYVFLVLLHFIKLALPYLGEVSVAVAELFLVVVLEECGFVFIHEFVKELCFYENIIEYYTDFFGEILFSFF